MEGKATAATKRAARKRARTTQQEEEVERRVGMDDGILYDRDLRLNYVDVGFVTGD